eukprot:NODE_6691_length_348_cov_65.090301_g5965_i0.p1 GENE.NODE_6691_length_348_cov_65.090301_g5965_i0~~NODE_6691_length_348_cov_65.090301_g5965_i0.p1  ORF type:complete len:64 (+),score=5.46 NODE_6691_length_348_cov_65.090301_g5965_i0:100-291(+)
MKWSRSTKQVPIVSNWACVQVVAYAPHTHREVVYCLCGVGCEWECIANKIVIILGRTHFTHMR